MLNEFSRSSDERQLIDVANLALAAVSLRGTYHCQASRRGHVERHKNVRYIYIIEVDFPHARCYPANIPATHKIDQSLPTSCRR